MASALAEFVRKHPALALFLLAFTLGVAPIALVAAGLLPAGFVQLGALSASVAGIILARMEGGRRGAVELLRRALIWRVGLGWWLVVLAFPALLALGAIYVARLADPGAPGWAGIGSPPIFLGTMVFLIVFAGLGEEFGWRGFALPRVQARHRALAASLIIGGVHSLWHVPLFFMEGIGQPRLPASRFPAGVPGLPVLVVAGAVQSTWIFNNTRGSVLLVAVYHGVLNTWASQIDITSGRLGGIYAYTALSALASIVIVIAFGAGHLSRTSRRVELPGTVLSDDA
jgi:membrane protease YdiL (CAAX protease family)